jgi:uncharacterized protein YwqG
MEPWGLEPMTRDEAVALISQSALSDFADQIIEQMQPSVRVEATRVIMDEVPPCASRFWGCPDVPEDFCWPTWVGSKVKWDRTTRKSYRTPPEVRKLDFVAQINLEQLHEFARWSGIPNAGTLYFFYDLGIQPWGYDPQDKDAAKVIWVADNNNLVRWNENCTPNVDWEPHPCRLSFCREWTIPDWWSFGFEYERGWEIHNELRKGIGVHRENDRDSLHRILGWPDQIQGDMQLECQLVANGLYCGDSSGYNDPRATSLRAGAEDWKLLLQIDTDYENPGWMWGDVGRIYYWIHRAELRQGQFENCRLVLQCY